MCSVNVFAQIDSATQRSGKLSLRMNDWEYITTLIAFTNTYEDLYDSLKVKARPLSNAAYPGGTTLVTIDSITNAELNSLCYTLKSGYTKATSVAADRIITAIRSISTYAAYRQDQLDAEETSQFNIKRNLGRAILRRR